jgi:hypothetical protein
MTVAINDLVTTVSRRLRDPSNIRHSAATVRKVLSHCQRALNYAKGDNLTTTAFTTTAGLTLYKITDSPLSGVQRIVTIQQDDRDLHNVDWREIVHVDDRWLRRTGPRHELWAPVGRDIFILYPAVGYATSVNVVFTAEPADMAAGAYIVLSDDLAPILAEMAEAILSVKNKQYDTIEVLVQRLLVKLALDTSGKG